jgi:hypothetical protein
MKVQYCIHDTPLLVPFLNQTNPLNQFFKIPLIILPFTLTSDLFHSDFPAKLVSYL